MGPYQPSFLGQEETFLPVSVSHDHEMVILEKALDWDLMQVIAEAHRDKVVKSNRGLKPHYRALNGAMVVRTLKNYDLRTTEDQIRHYHPARILCGLQNSHWTPDHVAIWEYEGMLGESGMKEMTDYVLRTATDVGFADPKGLCSDTTAQEGNIPYPNEVGHMNGFMKSCRKNLSTLMKNAKGLPKKALGKLQQGFAKAAKFVRSHRLFAKTKEARKEINQNLSNLSGQMLDQLGLFLSGLDHKQNQIKGMGKRALNNLSENYHNMCQMMAQIALWIQTGKVAKNKIISLFNPEFRSIKRGKIGKNIEFGLKWGINQIRGGYVSIFMHTDMMCHDANYAVLGVEEHIRLFGEAPKDFGFDRAGWSQEHKEQIKKLGVRNLAMAPKGKAQWDVGPRVKDRMTRERAQVEGKIGNMKRNGLNKPEARLNTRVKISALRAALCQNLRRFAKDIKASAMSNQAGALA